MVEKKGKKGKVFCILSGECFQCIWEGFSKEGEEEGKKGSEKGKREGKRKEGRERKKGRE